MQHIIEWNGNKYVWSSLSGAWYGHYGVRGDDYPGDNSMVPLRLWGHLFQAASQQGITISRTKPSQSEYDGDDGDDVRVKVKKIEKKAKKVFKSIQIFGE